MFGKKSAIDPKKAVQKFLDPKKESATRLKHLKNVLDTFDLADAKTFCETNYSCVYYVFYDQFITVESNLRQRAHKANREEFDVVLSIFDGILTLLPELLSRKWQCHSIGRIMKKLLHPGNALKLRREAMRLFLLWYQILGENAPEELHWIFACLVPGFSVTGDQGTFNLDSIIANAGLHCKNPVSATSFGQVVAPAEISPVLPPQSGDRQFDNLSKFFLENLMELMVSQVTKVEWRDKSIAHQQKCFEFLFEKFKKYYMPSIFPDFNWRTNVFMPCLELPEMRSLHNEHDNKVMANSSILDCKVIVIRWVANFTSRLQTSEITDVRTTSQQGPKNEDVENVKESKTTAAGSDGSSDKSSGHPSAPHVEKDSNLSTNATEDHSFIEHTIVRETLYGSRDNVNFALEVFRQALLLPWSESATMRRVIVVYREWITTNNNLPPFIYEPNESIFTSQREERIQNKSQSGNSGAFEGMHSNEGASSAARNWRPRNDSYLGAIYKESTHVRAGLQKTLQLFITHAANVFLQEVTAEDEGFLFYQVDMCKRVLNLYRYIVMNIKMEQKTWEQLLIVLLHITSQILGDTLPANKEATLGGRLAPALFQTLIVTWIKANLNVFISVELWDQFLEVLCSLTHWEELIIEWGKTMETLTRVLARLVYGVDLNDLPLDRLSEQKQKKRRGRLQPTENHAPTFARGWSRHGSGVGSQQSRNTDSALSDMAKTSDRPSAGAIASERKSKEWHSPRSRTSSGDAPCKGSMRPDSRTGRGTSLSRSASEGNLTSHSRSVSLRISPELSSGPASGAQAISEQDMAKMLSSFEEYMKETSPSSGSEGMRRSKSMDSLKCARASTPCSLSESSMDGPSRSPSPSLSTGQENNSIKDSPMQIDCIGGESHCAADVWDGSKEELRSIMAGGKKDGWLPDVAVVLWKRMLGILGDVNGMKDPEMHAEVFQHLIELFETLIKIRENQGVSTDNQSTPAPPELTPPVNIFAPWLFEAVTLPDKYKKGKLGAFRLLCSMTVRRHDVPLPLDHIVQFYGILHSALGGSDQDIINTIVKYCGPRFFSLKLPGSSLLLLDFIAAGDLVASAEDLIDVPRTEAMSILGAMICFPNVFDEIPALQCNTMNLTYVDKKAAKDNIVNVLLKSGRHEPSGMARCVALSSLAIYLYEELAHGTKHEKMKEAINVLLAALRVTNKIVGQVACNMLCLLTDHIVALKTTFPDVPKRIVEVFAATLNSLLSQSDILTADGDREYEQLVISMIICLGEWCMHLPQSLLVQPDANGVILLNVVFSVLTLAVDGAHSSHHPSTSQFVNLNFSDFDWDIQMNNLQDGSSMGSCDKGDGVTSSPEQCSSGSFSRPYSSPVMSDGPGVFSMIKLAAEMVITHLTNHLGHFPMGIGAARFTSMVNENDDIPGLNADDLSSDVFHAPNVQLFVLNNTTLISFVELPTLDAPGGGVTAGLTTAKSQVRIILRNMSGKFSWDASVLYGPPCSLENSNTNDALQEFHTSSRDGHSHEEDFLSGTHQSTQSAHLLSMRHPQSHGFNLPNFEDSGDNVDSLNDLLEYIGNTSPECLISLGQPLNIPQELPSKMRPESQEDVMTTVLNQRNYELDYFSRHEDDACMRGRPVHPSNPCDPESPFQQCRRLINQIGLMAWEKRMQFDLLKKNDKLLRELRNLDNQKCRETHKIAVIYVAEGQEDKNSVLMNTGGGQAYEEFVAGLAWEVELRTHTGFMGGLHSNGSTGDTAPYYATSFMEVIFHVATRMPSNSEDTKLQKLRHLGNDEVHIVWSEHYRDYRHGIITTEFGDVLIVIYPLQNKLYRIQITRKPSVPFFGPLFDGAIVDDKVLPGLVRATAINASRATRSALPIYQHFYKERAKALQTIIKNHKNPTTFENFTSNVVMPSGSDFHLGASCASGCKYDSANVLALSNLAAALLDAHPRHSCTPARSRPSSLSSTSDQSTPAYVQDIHGRESFDTCDSEDFSKSTSPKSSKRLSFKSNTRKSHPPPPPVTTPPGSPPSKGKK